MTITELKDALAGHHDKALTIQLPDGSQVPAHFHITEVAFVKKDFIDCGGTVRHEGKCQLQVWVADDYDHRVDVGRLLAIIKHGTPVLPTEALPIEFEYEFTSGGFPLISQLPLTGVTTDDDTVTLTLTGKETDCLAKDVCGVSSPTDSCAPGSGCC